MNYEELSDFEINKRVALSLGESPFISQCINFGCGKSSVPVGFGNCMRNVDYCNSWSDGGSVIEENNIWIQPDMIGDGLWHCYDREDEFHSKHKNPLRAAMIVFLMMKDAEK